MVRLAAKRRRKRHSPSAPCGALNNSCGSSDRGPRPAAVTLCCFAANLASTICLENETLCYGRLDSRCGQFSELLGQTMAMQYRLRTLLIAIAFVSICLGGMTWRWTYNFGNLAWFYHTMIIVHASPYWIPVVFGSYAVGRRQMTLPYIFCFAAAEVAAVGAGIWFHRMLTR